MPGKDLYVGGQGEEAIEGVDELGEIASGEVGTAVAHFKERVAREEDFVLREIETDTAGSVAGGGEDTPPLLPPKGGNG